MKYPTGRQIRIGDNVIVDHMPGVVVCDFDRKEFLDGYESWDIPDVELHGGYKLSSGVMIRTEVAGLIHYQVGADIEHVDESAVR